MRESPSSESSIQTNNLVPEKGFRVGEWMKEMGIEAEKAVVWPHEKMVEESLIEEGEVGQVVGLTPKDGFSRKEGVAVASETSHGYSGGNFDFEYGWALADDMITALKPLIEPKNNLHQFEYDDIEQRDKALDRAFERITSTSDRLLNVHDSAVLYSMDAINRYEMPELTGDVWRNQLEYAQRIASNLEDKGFETKIHYNQDARDIYLSGQR